MIRLSWKLKVSLVLVASSAALSILHVFLFRDLYSLLFYLALDVVFVPIQVLLVTILIERLMNEREKQIILRKMNMVIGAFFGELGNRLIGIMEASCSGFSTAEKALAITHNWRKLDYEAALEFIKSYECEFDSTNLRLQHLKEVLLEKREFVMGLLQNPNLFEHDRFTDLLMSVCHLTEELEARNTLQDLPASDVAHLQNDIKRVFNLIVSEWLHYMQHLRVHYPYMHSLSVRMNPFNKAATPVVTNDQRG